MDLERQFDEISVLIREARISSYRAVNRELISLYLRIGEYISVRVKSSEWGKSVVNNLAAYLKLNEPDSKGFSAQNLWRMKQFYETYSNEQKLSPLAREISWSNNLLIISKTNSYEEKEFYLKLSIKENLTKRELERQIDSNLFERIMINDVSTSLSFKEHFPKSEKVFKDNYILDFLSLPKNHSEKELRKSIIENLKHFILEFGKDFTFVGEEYRVQVGNSDFYIDLLFYHRDLQCLVAIDLKNN